MHDGRRRGPPILVGSGNSASSGLGVVNDLSPKAWPGPAQPPALVPRPSMNLTQRSDCSAGADPPEPVDREWSTCAAVGRRNTLTRKQHGPDC